MSAEAKGYGRHETRRNCFGRRPDATYRPDYLPFGWREIPLWALNRGVQVPIPGSLTESALALGTMLKWFARSSEDTICFVATSKGRSDAAELNCSTAGVGQAHGHDGPCPVVSSEGLGFIKKRSPTTRTKWWFDKKGHLHKTVTDEEGTWDIDIHLANKLLELI